jgi:hypothetical protein
MESTTNIEETPRTPMVINLATRNANPDEEPEMCEQPGDEGAWENYWDPWGTYCD